MDEKACFPTAICRVSGRQVFDSRANPTVAARVRLRCGATGEAMVPSGASTGAFEARELRDGGEPFGGKGVTRAVSHVKGVLAQALTGLDADDQLAVDRAMLDADGTESKSRLGANAILALSLASAKAAAAARELPLYRWLGGAAACTLPLPMMNILNGGAHAGNNLDVQEFMIVPVGAKRFSQAMEMGVAVYHSLGRLLRERGLSTAVGDEGGFAPDLPGDEEALALLCQAIEAAGYRPGQDLSIALDAAASEWSQGDGYRLPKRGQPFTPGELAEYWCGLCGRWPIVSLEDPLGENDFAGFAALTVRLGDRVQIVGDDLFVTNPARLRQGIEVGAANAVLVKPNQIGTLSETAETVSLARQNGYRAILSHRSGETEDTSIADLAVGLSAGQIKTGAPARSERVCKYNRLLAIEEELGRRATLGRLGR
ncbi:phosphopyruvate hydratase [bacterium 210820-DFI.6.52]|nr:phosphopyruvate hydratase [bacterium 210820-DFI.6.52]